MPEPSIPSRKRSSLTGSSDAGCGVVITFDLRSKKLPTVLGSHRSTLPLRRLSMVQTGTLAQVRKGRFHQPGTHLTTILPQFAKRVSVNQNSRRLDLSQTLSGFQS